MQLNGKNFQFQGHLEIITLSDFRLRESASQTIYFYPFILADRKNIKSHNPALEDL